MPIQFACKCGRSLSVPDKLAGKAVKCPQCKQPLRVPQVQQAAAGVASQPSGLEDLLDEVGLTVAEDGYEGQHCPGCNAPIADNAVICVECGLNLETGRFVKGILPVSEKKGGNKAEGHEGAAELLLEKAEGSLKKEKIEQFKNRTEGMPLWLLFSCLAVIGTLTVTMSLMSSRSQAMHLSGSICVGVFGFFSVLHTVRLLVLAFLEDVKTGLMALLIPLYILFFVLTRWERSKPAFVDFCYAAVLASVGIGMLASVPLFPDEEPTGGRPTLAPPSAVVRMIEEPPRELV